MPLPRPDLHSTGAIKKQTASLPSRAAAPSQHPLTASRAPSPSRVRFPSIPQTKKMPGQSERSAGQFVVNTHQ